MSDTILDVRNLQVQFRTDEQVVRAVDGISFTVKRGQTLGIVGESGSGKSVTSLAVIGLVPSPPGEVVSGEIWFQDGDRPEPVDLRSLPPEQLRLYRGERIAMIFQEPMSSLNPVYTCGFQLIEMIQQHQDIPKAEARRRAINLLQEVKLVASDEDLAQDYRDQQQAIGAAPPSDREVMQAIAEQKQAILKRYPHELSGGQLQRVMIAMAISCNPSLLIADEPTTALDVTVQALILDLLRELRDRRGMSILFITHDLGIIADIADDVVVMYQGKIVEQGSVVDIFDAPQHPYTKGLLTCRPQPDRRMRYLPTVSDFMQVSHGADGAVILEEKPLAQADLSRIGEQISDTEVSDRLTSLTQSSPLLSVQNLQVGFPVRGLLGQTQRYVMAVNGVSFDVYPGETLGLVGESGCGKTTLARALMRLVPSMGGRITFDSLDVTAVQGRELRMLRRELQIVFQNPYSSLDPRLTVGAAIMEPMIIHGTLRQTRQRRERVLYLLERVGLEANAIDRYPHEFSGGQRQRVCIARSLALNPKFIICDESVSALDVSVQAQVLNLLKELQDEFGLTYIFISHDLGVVKFMSDRIMVMNQGKVEELGPAEQIYQSPQKPYTQSLIAAIPLGNLEQIQYRQEQRRAAVKG